MCYNKNVAMAASPLRGPVVWSGPVGCVSARPGRFALFGRGVTDRAQGVGPSLPASVPGL